MKTQESLSDQIEKISVILKKIDSQDLDFINKLMDEIGVYQPFMASMMLGFNHDLNTAATEEVLAVYLLVWAFFRDYPGARTVPITLEGFEKISHRNIELMDYLNGEKDSMEFKKTVSFDLAKLNSKDLLAAVLLRFNTRPAFLSLEVKDKGFVLLGIKSLIECFEQPA